MHLHLLFALSFQPKIKIRFLLQNIYKQSLIELKNEVGLKVWLAFSVIFIFTLDNEKKLRSYFLRAAFWIYIYAFSFSSLALFFL